MIKRKYFFKIELKPDLRDAALERGDFTLVTGTTFFRSFFANPLKVYKALIPMAVEHCPDLSMEASDLMITSFNPI